MFGVPKEKFISKLVEKIKIIIFDNIYCKILGHLLFIIYWEKKIAQFNRIVEYGLSGINI